jgi:hypothetical protein
VLTTFAWSGRPTGALLVVAAGEAAAPVPDAEDVPDAHAAHTMMMTTAQKPRMTCSLGGGSRNARGETRTRKTLRSEDFESSASTNSTTRAGQAESSHRLARG